MREKVIESMITNIIRKYGFEHEKTIRFCIITETCLNLKFIRKLYRKFMDE